MDSNAAIHRKLLFGKFPRKLVLNRPKNLRELDGADFDTRADGVYDLVFAFVFSLDEMESVIHGTASDGLVSEGGCLYLAYPKKGNGEYREYINRDDIFPRLNVDEDDGFVAGTPFKFNKMAALNETFTVVGLRCFQDKSKVKKSRGGGVDEYVRTMPELRAALDGQADVLAHYNALPYGYQKDWARHVYSAKTGATREKRLAEMAEILRAGYKSIALFRRAR
jgi:hypothetical protein